MMSRGFGIYVVVLVTLNIAGAMWLLWSMRKRGGDEAQPGAETTGHVWDGDLREYNNPLPRWWLWLFVLTTLFAVIYLALYPGLGTYRGLLGWTAVGQHEAEEQVAEAQSQQLLARFTGKSVSELQHDPAALTVGRNLFANNCIACHGSDAHGLPGFPNLTDNDWLWGGTPDTVVETITNGRMGIMVPWRDALAGDAGVEDVLAYVLSLSGRALPTGDVNHGQQLFMTFCTGCHGADAHGNQLVGAPNLTDQTWLHGSSVSTIRDVIANGRQGQMPAWGERLGTDRVRLLAAYVLSLGDGH
jgi:cytochrome c oxidase cbb3-type subunit 3